MAKIRNKKTGKVIEVYEDDLHIYGLGRKKLPKALLGKKQHGDLEAIYNQGNQSFNEDTTDPFSQMDYSDLPMLQPNIGFQGLINEKNNGFPLSDSPYSTLKRPQTYQMDKLPTQLIPEQQAPQFRPLSEDTQNQQNKFNWQNGIDAASIANQGLRQFQMGTKGFINNIINNSLTNRDNFRNATQFGQSAYADAENRPQGQIYGKDIRGGNALFANGGINLKELYTPETNKANIEVEKNEFISIPHMDNGGHSGLSEKVNFGGSHGEITNGSSGTPMNLPANTLVFSVQNKVKKTPLLAPLLEDGLLKAGDIGKPWSSVANKFKTVDDVNRKENKFSDSIQKTTADMLINMKQAKQKRLFEEGQEPEKLYGFQGKKAQLEAIQSLQQEQQPGQKQNQMPMGKNGMKLPKAEYGWNTAWTSKILEHERKSGAPGGKPFTSGYDEKDWSNGKFEKEYVEKVRKEIPNFDALPDDIKQKLVDYKFNTGRNTRDLVSFATGKINLNEINSLATPDRFNSDLLNTPNLSQKLNHAKEDVYMTTHKNDPNFQENFDKNWFPRIKMWDDKTSKNTFNTGYNPNVIDPRINRLPENQVGLRNNYLPYQSGQEPYVYGQDLKRWVDDFSLRTGIPTENTEQGLANIRTYQSLANPGLVQDYKTNFARGNQDSYNEFTSKKNKSYKKGKTDAEESQNFYDWSIRNNKLGQDYVDKGKPGHEYFRTDKLPFTKEEFFGADGNPKDKDWVAVESNGKKYYVDRSAYASSGDKELDKKRGLPPITYYELDGENLKPVTKEPTKSNVVDKTQYKIPERKQDKSFNMPNLNLGIPLPYNEKTTPLNYYKINPEFIDPRYLNVQPQLNDITRGVRTVQNNLGDRSTASVGNSLQAQINAYGQQDQVYGNKYNYDKSQDLQAQQSNAETEMNTRLYNQNSWYNQLEDPIRARSSAKNKQFKENQQRGLENWNEQMAFNNNSNYINDTFYNPKNINNINWVANLNPVDIKKAKESKWNDEIEKEQYIKQKKAELGFAKNGGKVRIKPKIKLK